MKKWSAPNPFTLQFHSNNIPFEYVKFLFTKKMTSLVSDGDDAMSQVSRTVRQRRRHAVPSGAPNPSTSTRAPRCINAHKDAVSIHAVPFRIQLHGKLVNAHKAQSRAKHHCAPCTRNSVVTSLRPLYASTMKPYMPSIGDTASAC